MVKWLSNKVRVVRFVRPDKALGSISLTKFLVKA